MSALPVFMSAHYEHTLLVEAREEGLEPLKEHRVTDSLTSGFWELNLDLLQDNQWYS